MANGGTIFLDEIGDMDLKLQAKLLQVLQDQEFIKLGARETTRVDVRVIAATHCDLETLAAQGFFRMDLYYRLNVVNIVIPPLRERRDEIVPLASLFLKRHNRSDGPLPQIGSDLKTALLNYEWPGNARELENLMRRYLVIRDANVLLEELQNKTVLEARPTQTARPSASPSASNFSVEPIAQKTPIPIQTPLQGVSRAVQSDLAKVDEARKKAETDVILRALNSTLWNRKRAATLLGIDYKAFLYKMKKLSIAAR
jgi:two-component system response regulator AtoC